MKRPYFLLLAAVIVALVCIVSTVHHSYSRPQSQPQHITIQYTVRDGDTLWSIAKQFCPAEMDIRQFISEVITEGNYGLLKSNADPHHPFGTVYPGQVLVIEYWQTK